MKCIVKSITLSERHGKQVRILIQNGIPLHVSTAKEVPRSSQLDIRMCINQYNMVIHHLRMNGSVGPMWSRNITLKLLCSKL